MSFDLTTASVRPAGSSGMASRTAAGFVVLASQDGADLISFVDEHQLAPDLIERLASEITERQPETMAMLFTAGGTPYLLAWGAAVASVASASAQFTVTPLAGQLLVHPLMIDATSTVVLSHGSLAGEPETTPINLAQGSMYADAVVIDLTGEVPEAIDTEAALPSLDTPAAEPALAPEPSLVPVDAAPTPPVFAAPVVAAPPLGQPALVDDDGFGQPAAQEIVFAEDLDEIVDLIDEPTQAIVPNEPIAAMDIPVAPIAAPAIELDPVGFDAPTEATPPVAAPVATSFSDAAAAAPSASPIVSQAPAPQVPPEFQRVTPPEPAVAPAEPTTPAPAVTATGTLGPVMVLGIVCPQGHHNHPEAVYCSQCGTKMGVHQTTVLVNGPRPPLGVLVVDDGSTFSIDQDLVVGRDPASHPDVRAGTAGPMPLSDDTLALSRRHARIMLDEWSVNLTDLGSSNGTWVNRGPNPQDWIRVDEGIEIPLEPGDRLRVGGRIIQVELHHIR